MIAAIFLPIPHAFSKPHYFNTSKTALRMKIKTQAVGFQADGKLIDFIDQKLSKLEQFYDRIINAEVSLKLENSGQVRDKIAEVRVSVPGSVLVTKESDKSFEAAIDASVGSLKRQIIKHKEKNSSRR